MKILCVLSLFAFAISASGQNISSIHGVWKCTFEGYTMVVELNPDGTGKLDGEPITYKVSNGKITVTESGNQVTIYSYSIAGNKMTVSGGDLDEAMTFTKETSTSGLGGKLNQQKSTSPTPDKKSESTNKLNGTWTGATGSFTFNDGGKGIANGQNFTYTMSGNQITMTDNGGTYTFTYTISGNNLQLDGYGRTLSFSRNSAGSGTTTKSSTGKGAELVGKWCYLTSNYNSLYGTSNSSFTDECFTLNGDGTYSYHFEANRSANSAGAFGYSNTTDSDKGTWSFDGVNKVTVNSQKNGTAVYIIEKKNHPKTGDPMIFVDGKGFVTYYKKAPW